MCSQLAGAQSNLCYLECGKQGPILKQNFICK